MIHYEKKCILVHIPRSGGTSIENAIWPPYRERTEKHLWMGFNKDTCYNKYQSGGLQHLFAKHIKEEVGNSIYQDLNFQLLEILLKKLFLSLFL